MARLNTRSTGTRGSTPLKTTGSGSTHEGGVGFVSDDKSELYRLGVNLIGNDNDGRFYESGKARDTRHTDLAAKVALDDPTWVAGFYPWLRKEGNIRTASIMGAASVIHSRLDNSGASREDELLSSLGYRGTNRHLAATVPTRADEPTEFAQYYMKTYGKLPKALKRGLGDSANRLWNPYSVMKYDTASKGMRFADLMNLGHFTLDDAQLAGHIMNRRFGNAEITDALPTMIRENIQLRHDVANGNYDALLNPARLRAAGMTWEDALSLAGNHVNKGKLWSALILAGMVPIFATVRNLRNFDEAGISNEAKEYVHKQLTNPEVIAKSRMFPFRFLQALEAVSSYNWHSDLETATQLSTGNIPELDGQTLVLVDTSASMDGPISSKSKMTASGMAAFFGGAFAAKNAGNVDMYIYANYTAPVDVRRGTSALKLASEMSRRTGEVGHGTQTGDAIRQTIKPNHKRVMIFTDMQSFSHGIGSYNFYGHATGQSLRSLVPDKVHMYAWDLGGYHTGDIESGQYNRSHQLGGMTDSTFKWIPLVERGFDAKWPWEQG